MLGFVTPPDVSKSFKVPPRSRAKVDVPEWVVLQRARWTRPSSQTGPSDS